MISSTKNVCVECGTETPHLYTLYQHSQALAMTTCQYCNSVCDPYLEHDVVLKAIDLILHKPAIYRHLLFNWTREKYLCDGDIRMMSGGGYMKRRWWLLVPMLEVLGHADSITFGLIVRFSLLWVLRFLCLRWLICRHETELLPFMLLLTSFPLLFNVLMLIWRHEYQADGFAYEWLVRMAVLTSQAEGLNVISTIGYLKAYFYVLGTAALLMVIFRQ